MRELIDSPTDGQLIKEACQSPPLTRAGSFHNIIQVLLSVAGGTGRGPIVLQFESLFLEKAFLKAF